MTLMKNYVFFLCIVFWTFEVRAMVPAESGTNVLPKFNIAVRVLLARHLPSAQLNAERGKIKISVDKNRWFNADKNLRVEKSPVGLRVNGQNLSSTSLWIRADAGATIGFQAALYADTLQIQSDGSEIFVTHEVDLENYVATTVASEMPPSWEKEALRAQAVASRSYVGFMLRHPRHRFYDVEGSVMDQAYNGGKDPGSAVREAVRSTRGVVLTEENSSSPAKALFHSRCGGQTEKPNAIWPSGAASSLQVSGVKCPYCLTRPQVWETRVTWPELRRRLSLAPSLRPALLSATKVASSGRVLELSISSEKDHITLSGDEFRRSLGYSRIKSTMLRWERDPAGIVFRGTGAGHGSGMCQWGARALARAGKNYREILTYFYPRSKLRLITVSD